MLFPAFFFKKIYTKGPDLPGFERGAVTFQRGDTFLLAGGLNTDFEETDRVNEKKFKLKQYKTVVKRVGKNLLSALRVRPGGLRVARGGQVDELLPRQPRRGGRAGRASQLRRGRVIPRLKRGKE